jgi:hypothetical protein
MKTALKVLLATSLLVGCSSTPEATEAETTATAAATATSDMEAPPETTAAPSTTAAEAAPPAPEPGADLVVAPVKITLDAKTSIEIKADKGIYFKNKKIATFEKNALKLEGMDHHMAVMKDGTIEMKPAAPKKVRFNDKDEVELDNGGRIAIDDKGKVVMTPPEGKENPKDFKPTITGFKPEGRRAASLGLLLAMMTASEPQPAPGTVTTTTSAVPPKASAAPATTGTAPKK